MLLVVRGGQFPEIRTRSTSRACSAGAGRGLMKPDTADKLGMAYVFLRQVEHRIQDLDDQQTHLLPTQDADLAWIALSLGLEACQSGACPLLDRLCEIRELVATESTPCCTTARHPHRRRARNGCKQCGAPPLAIDSDGLLDKLPATLAERVRLWREQPRVLALRDDSKLRLGKLVQRTAACIADHHCTEAAALCFIDWLEPLCGATATWPCWSSGPEVMRRCCACWGWRAGRMQYLMRHPGVIDELSDQRLLNQRFEAG